MTGGENEKDFRFGELPFTGTKTHKFWFRQELGVNIHWNLPNGVTGLLQDVLTSGNIINYPMAGQDSFYVSYNFIDEINMILYYDNVIPVEITSFNASVLLKEKAVQLNWSTATETNNLGFEVERKLKNQEWVRIAFVEGHGTTTEINNYSYVDDYSLLPYEGTVLYRLKQINYDGSFKYSDQVAASLSFIPSEYYVSQNYPNPFNPSTTIKFSIPEESQVKINIYNSIGQVIEQLTDGIKDPGNYEVKWNAGNNSSGIYFYSFEVNSTDGNQSHREIKKIVFLK